MQLQGKVALVTGGTDGIGAELIRQLRAKGASVIASGRNPERDADEANVGMVKLLQAVHSVSPALARRIMLKF